jgi:hypothetical protein
VLSWGVCEGITAFVLGWFKCARAHLQQGVAESVMAQPSHACLLLSPACLE